MVPPPTISAQWGKLTIQQAVRAQSHNVMEGYRDLQKHTDWEDSGRDSEFET